MENTNTNLNNDNKDLQKSEETFQILHDLAKPKWITDI